MVSLLTHICVTRPQWVNGWCDERRLMQSIKILGLGMSHTSQELGTTLHDVVICYSLVLVILFMLYEKPSTSEVIRRKFTTRRLLYWEHYNGIIMSAMASQITGVSIVCSTVGSGTNQRILRTKASNAENVSIWWRHHESHNQRNKTVSIR